MRYKASFLAYAFWVYKTAAPKNWLMRVKGLNNYILIPSNSAAVILLVIAQLECIYVIQLPVA